MDTKKDIFHNNTLLSLSIVYYVQAMFPKINVISLYNMQAIIRRAAVTAAAMPINDILLVNYYY